MTEIVRYDAYAHSTLDERRSYAQAIAQAGDLLPKSLWTTPQMVDGVMRPPAPSPAKVLLLAETGAMLGIHPMAALQGVHIIEGKPSLSANLLGALVRRAGHKLRVTTSGDWADGTFIAKAVLIRSDDPDFEFIVEWTKKRATTAGLAGKGNWAKYPEAMCKARAITEVIREGAPDVTLVAAYTPEELGAPVQGEDAEPIEPHQSAPAPRAQAPIVEPSPVFEEAEVVAEEVVDDTDWEALLAEAETLDQVKDLYREARSMGLLGLTVDWAGEQRALGDVITEVGKSFSELVAEGSDGQ